MIDYKKYWEDRYHKGGNSGSGSYNNAAILKSNYINSIIKKYNIKTINDFGHGDGNQLSYLKGYDQYYGYDISMTTRKKCKDKFKSYQNITFVNDINDLVDVDLNMSLDVLYHIIDKNDFYQYLNRLFIKSKYVLIYGVDKNMGDINTHFYARPFLGYIQEQFKNYELLDIHDGIHNDVKFYFFKKTGEI